MTLASSPAASPLTHTGAGAGSSAPATITSLPEAEKALKSLHDSFLSSSTFTSLPTAERSAVLLQYDLRRQELALDDARLKLAEARVQVALCGLDEERIDNELKRIRLRQMHMQSSS